MSEEAPPPLKQTASDSSYSEANQEIKDDKTSSSSNVVKGHEQSNVENQPPPTSSATVSSSSSSAAPTSDKRNQQPAATTSNAIASNGNKKAESSKPSTSKQSSKASSKKGGSKEEEDVIIADAMNVDVISGQILKKTNNASTNKERDSGLQSPNNSFPAFPDPPPTYHQGGKASPTLDDPAGDHSELYVLCCAKCLCLSSLTNQNKQQKFNPKKLVQGVPLEEIRSWGNSFEGLMRHECGRKVFAEFLRLEYSEENMLFWSACEELKKEPDSEKLAERARLIYKDYVSVLSPREVSLDAHVRELINQRITKPTPEIFKEAQAQIFILMQRDSYPRFIVSPIYMKVAHYKQKKTKLKKTNSMEQQKQ